MTNQEFDILNSPLAGTNLIEASAGTGKTYTITGLFVRLVLEKDLMADQILVVTFTEAATKELRDRIRAALRKAEKALLEKKSDDEFFHNLILQYGDSQHAVTALRQAIRNFDQAAIFTIHGFCKRILDENAFESGNLFDTELMAESANLNQEIIYDFWRKHIYHESPLFVNFALAHHLSPAKLLKLVSRRIMSPAIKIIPPLETAAASSEAKALQNLELAFQQRFHEVRSTWESARSEIIGLLLDNPNLNRQLYNPVRIPLWIEQMDRWLSSDGSDPMAFDQFKKFTTRIIEQGTKKNGTAPRHQFFDRCEALQQQQTQLLEAYEQKLLQLKIHLLSYWQTELDRRKKEKNVQSFDDLLLKLYSALKSPGGEELAEAVRKKFKAALIDEFQDTDPIQYAIFKNIFQYQDHLLFLIGDPKQAIYGFRGADIFAYMEAAQQVAARYTLSCNWRAEPGLITAINTLFSQAQLPFVFPAISFLPARAAAQPDRVLLRVQERTEPPLQLWFLEAHQFAENDKPIPKAEAREFLYHAVASEVARLLNLSQQHAAQIGERPIQEMDLAVLVRRNSEAVAMQRALFALNIPSVLLSTTNLFDSHEAVEMQRLLSGIAQPNDAALLRTALATDLMGLAGETIETVMNHDRVWEQWLIQFKNYHDLWRRRGFFQMFRQLLTEQQVLPRLMAFSDGERRCTNVLHLAEVLHQAALEKNLGMTGLVKWLAEQRDPNTPRLEQHQLRLETDENAVKLVTVHKSKGLEYSIVFCPFTWDGSRIGKSPDYLLFHDEANHHAVTLDLGSEFWEPNCRQAEKELLAENLRLLYVALTRARHRCYLVWGRFNEAESAAPAYLFHQAKSNDPNSLLDATSLRVQTLNDATAFQELQAIAARSEGTIQLTKIKPLTDQSYQSHRIEAQRLVWQPFRTTIDSSWRISSYSSLTSRLSYAAELPDYDPTTGIGAPAPMMEISREPLGPEAGIMAFPHGNKAGIFFHQIFELIDFQDHSLAATTEIVADKLQEFGFEAHWQSAVMDMIQKVLALPLDPQQDDFTLSKISNPQRLNELEFYFPLKSISPQKLKGVFENFVEKNISSTWPEQIGRLSFSPLRGFMKGFMDLVFQHDQRFYLIDWKSNFLGPQIEDYHEQKLGPVMEQEFYTLQYLIYTVALNQYLRHRWPEYRYEQHFGGIFYIFLRGVDPRAGAEYGVFRDRPAEELVRRLQELLIG